MVAFDTPNGGSVFSVGSIPFPGALFADAPCAQITRSVLERFLSQSARGIVARSVSEGAVCGRNVPAGCQPAELSARRSRLLVEIPIVIPARTRRGIYNRNVGAITDIKPKLRRHLFDSVARHRRARKE